MTWNGIAMYAGIAIGAPLSIALSNHYGLLPAFSLGILLLFTSGLATAKLPSIPVDKTHIRTPQRQWGGICEPAGKTADSSSCLELTSKLITITF